MEMQITYFARFVRGICLVVEIYFSIFAFKLFMD